MFKQGKTDLFDGIDSFGTGTYHAGESADSRSVAACRKHGVTVNHRAQKIQSRHFNDFDYLLAIDESNYEDLIEMATSFHGKDNYRAKVQLFGTTRPILTIGKLSAIHIMVAPERLTKISVKFGTFQKTFSSM